MMKRACKATILLGLLIFVSDTTAQTTAESQSAPSDRLSRRVQNFYAAKDRKDKEAARRFLAADARMWFNKKEGPGEPWSVSGGTWDHWDTYFNGHTTYSEWKVEGNAVTATGVETNDYYRLLDWHPWPMKLTWWFNESGRMTGFLVQQVAGKGGTGSRLTEFTEWGKDHHPVALRYLMPKGDIDPSADRPERWRKLLVRWRNEVGLPAVNLSPPGR